MGVLSVYHVHVECLQRPEEGMGSLELELWVLGKVRGSSAGAACALLSHLSIPWSFLRQGFYTVAQAGLE